MNHNCKIFRKHTGDVKIRLRQAAQIKTRRAEKADNMPSQDRPAYRPAGKGLPTRRPHEDFAAQIARVAKAKIAAPTITTPTLMQSMPKVPPQPPRPPPRRQAENLTTMTTAVSSPIVPKTPKEPPYPPPAKEMASIPQPKTPPQALTPPKPPSARRKSSVTSSMNSGTDTSSENPVIPELSRVHRQGV